jgi:hypothetical protein
MIDQQVMLALPECINRSHHPHPLSGHLADLSAGARRHQGADGRDRPWWGDPPNIVYAAGPNYMLVRWAQAKAESEFSQKRRNDTATGRPLQESVSNGHQALLCAGRGDSFL